LEKALLNVEELKCEIQGSFAMARKKFPTCENIWSPSQIYRQQEEARKAREHLSNVWEGIQLNIRELSRALGNETNKLLF